MNGEGRALLTVGVVCAVILVLVGDENGHWLFGLTMMAIAFVTVWLVPWFWLRFIAFGFTIAPADPAEASAYLTASDIVLRIGIPVWLLEIASLSLPADWNRFDVSWLFSVLQLATPITGALLGFRARTAPPQADQSSSRTS